MVIHPGVTYQGEIWREGTHWRGIDQGGIFWTPNNPVFSSIKFNLIYFLISTIIIKKQS